MSRLYIAPVGSDWCERFDQTVGSPISASDIDLPSILEADQEIRIWGTSDGKQKYSYFTAMETGDPVLFYSDGEFFASGRIGVTLEDAALGERLWDSAESKYIYTISEYEPISVLPAELGDLLSYGEGWHPRGFMRVSEQAINSLLTEYNSVEEAFQDLRSDESVASPSEPETETEQASDADDGRVHTEIQWYLVQLGQQHGYDVHVAINDKNRTYQGERLGEGCLEELVLPGFSDAVTNIIRYVDVIWLEGDAIVAMFEVESTTSIYSGILRMTDFVTRVPNFAVDMYIVAAESDSDAVRKEMTRPTFETVLEPVSHSSLQFLSFEDVRERYETVVSAGPLQEVF
ncbi:hypothetical protein [Natrinema soli]|nr:hypothetical protein [Natrinema soli]